jgi:hypothetical protein
MSLLQKDAHGRTLYTVAYEVRRRVNGVLDVRVGFEYYHALDQANARMQFMSTHHKVRGLHITGIAPTIGFGVKDEHAEKLVT